MVKLRRAVFVLAVMLGGMCGQVLATPSAPPKIIIDADPGTDDAMAILLALNSPEVDVKAITVVAGNVTAKQGLENALKLVSLAK